MQRERSRALSWLLVAVPLSLALGAPVSSLLLDVKWFALDGWQWLFIVEGLPAVLLGLIVLVCFTDRPRDAKWLTQVERDHLEGELAAEATAKEATGKLSVGQALCLPRVWLLVLAVTIGNSGGYALTFWLPTTVKNLSGGSDQMTLFYSGLYYSCGIVSVLVSGYTADRTGDRKWHAAGGMIATGIFLLCSTIPGQSFGTQMIWLCFTALGAFFWISPSGRFPLSRSPPRLPQPPRASLTWARISPAMRATTSPAGCAATATANRNASTFSPPASSPVASSSPFCASKQNP